MAPDSTLAGGSPVVWWGGRCGGERQSRRRKRGHSSGQCRERRIKFAKELRFVDRVVDRRLGVEIRRVSLHGDSGEAMQEEERTLAKRRFDSRPVGSDANMPLRILAAEKREHDSAGSDADPNGEWPTKVSRRKRTRWQTLPGTKDTDANYDAAFARLQEFPVREEVRRRKRWCR